jgi:hypothetical protein
MLELDTVTVAWCCPGTRPVLGATVKVFVLPVAILETDVLDSVKRLVFDNETVKLPVATLPLLVIVTVLADCEQYPTVASGKVYIPDSLKDILYVTGMTWKFAFNVAASVPAIDIVTTAVYDPTARPVFGVTVNVPVLPVLMLLKDVFDSVNALALLPSKATVKAPVAIVPVLVIVTVLADCEP